MRIMIHFMLYIMAFILGSFVCLTLGLAYIMHAIEKRRVQLMEIQRG